MVETKKKLSELAQIMEVLPQALVNAKVPNHKKKVTWNIQKLQRQSVNWRKICRRRKGSNPSIWYRTIGSCHDRRQNQEVIQQEAKQLADLITKVML